MSASLGLKEKDREVIVDGLAKLLANSYMLLLKTHYFHWNVTGPMFTTLHLMFEQEYQELFLAVDEIAERMRALGAVAPGSYKAFSKLSSIVETEKVPVAEEMIKQLLKDNEMIVVISRKLFSKANIANDEPTADLLTQRMQTHEKAAWMLRSLIS